MCNIEKGIKVSNCYVKIQFLTYFYTTTTIYTIDYIMYFELENDEMESIGLST